MGSELRILGGDAGVSNLGLTMLGTNGARVWPVKLQRLHLPRDNDLKVWPDIAKRMQRIHDALKAFPVPNVVAVEEYLPHDAANKDGWKTLPIVGQVIEYGMSVGAVIVTVSPIAPKRHWHAIDKQGVCDALCGAVDGLDQALLDVGNTGWHVSDAAAAAYEGVRKVFARTLAGAK